MRRMILVFGFLAACGPAATQWPVYSVAKGHSSLSGTDTLTVAAASIAITGLGVQPAVSGVITSNAIDQLWTGSMDIVSGNTQQHSTQKVTTNATMRIVFAALTDGSWTLGISCLSLSDACKDNHRSPLMVELQRAIALALEKYNIAAMVPPVVAPPTAGQ